MLLLGSVHTIASEAMLQPVATMSCHGNEALFISVANGTSCWAELSFWRCITNDHNDRPITYRGDLGRTHCVLVRILPAHHACSCEDGYLGNGWAHRQGANSRSRAASTVIEHPSTRLLRSREVHKLMEHDWDCCGLVPFRASTEMLVSCTYFPFDWYFLHKCG